MGWIPYIGKRGIFSRGSPLSPYAVGAKKAVATATAFGDITLYSAALTAQLRQRRLGGGSRGGALFTHDAVQQKTTHQRHQQSVD